MTVDETAAKGFETLYGCRRQACHARDFHPKLDDVALSMQNRARNFLTACKRHLWLCAHSFKLSCVTGPIMLRLTLVTDHFLTAKRHRIAINLSDLPHPAWWHCRLTRLVPLIAAVYP